MSVPYIFLIAGVFAVAHIVVFFNNKLLTGGFPYSPLETDTFSCRVQFPVGNPGTRSLWASCQWLISWRGGKTQHDHLSSSPASKPTPRNSILVMLNCCVIPCYAMLYLKSMLYQSVLITSKYPFMPGHPGMRPRSRQDVVLQHVFEGVEEQQGAKDADRWVEPGQNRPGYQSVWGICGGSEYHERLETWIQWDEISSMVFGAQWCSWHA